MLRTGPPQGGVAAPLLHTDFGVGGHRAGYILRETRMGVYAGGGGGFGVIGAFSLALALVPQYLPRLGWTVVVGVDGCCWQGVPSTGLSIHTSVCGCCGGGGGSSSIAGGSWYITSMGGGGPCRRALWGLPTHAPSTVVNGAGRHPPRSPPFCCRGFLRATGHVPTAPLSPFPRGYRL